MRQPRKLLFALAAVAVVGCDSGPSGPGTLLATVDAGDALGAVTLEVVGPGITGFEGVGSTRAYGTTTSARQNRHRVVLVDPEGGTLQFGIQVEDVRGDAPTITAVSAAGTDNLERITSDIEIRVGAP